MGSLEDQLKKWKQQQPSTKPASSSSSSSSSSAARRPSTKKDPFPKQTLRRDEAAPPPPPPSPPPSDAELFRRALDRVDADVVLQKFDAGAPPAGRAGRSSAPAAPVETDEEMFRRFVGGSRTIAPAGQGDAEAERGPRPRLSLRGLAVDVATRRLRAFLDDAVRAGAASVVVEVDADGDALLGAVRAHPAVAAVHDAPAKDGGKNARVVRLRR